MKVNQTVVLVVAGTFAFTVQLAAAQYGAGTQKPKSAPPTKTTAAKAGGSHTMTGCLMKGNEPNTYMLTQIEGGGPKQAELISVPASLNLNAHIGHKVAITGVNVSTRQAARTETGTKKPMKTEQKEEAGEHHMRPTALKMIANSCS